MASPTFTENTTCNMSGTSSSPSSEPTTTLYNGRTASLRLHVLIVGCGLGGLAAAHTLSQAGHTITLLESASALGEVGAGIQVTPNVSRLLRRWGLGAAFDAVSVKPEAIVLRRYADGEIVGYTSWRGMEKRYGTPYWHVHRADFHRLLVGLLRVRVVGAQDKSKQSESSGEEKKSDDIPVTLRLKSTVIAVNPGGPPEEGGDRPSVTLSSGEIVEGDVIIGADGVKSFVQSVVLDGAGKRASPPRPTGDAVYRATIPADVMIKDPDLKPFIDTPEMTGWMGPRRHIMAYCIRAKKEFNIVLAHPDDGSVESWTAEGSAEKMRADFADFEPRVRKLLSHVSSTLKWRLMDREPLETWVHPSGRVTLLGDACHPMLPYRAQGAAMAIEDAAVLGSLFSRITHISQLKPMLYAYEGLRLARTRETQESSRLNQKIFHLEDGEEQRKRDESMREAARQDRERELHLSESAGGRRGEGSANQWADERKNDTQFGYDAHEVAERWWVKVGESEIGQLGKVTDGSPEERRGRRQSQARM